MKKIASLVILSLAGFVGRSAWATRFFPNMRSKSGTFVAGSIVGILLCVVPALDAQRTLIPSASGTLRTGDGFTLGGIFTVGGTTVIVTALGVYDATGNGLTTATPVGIWTGNGKVDGGTDPLLVSATVPTGSAATLFNGFRYMTLVTPVTLLAGQTYTIGAYYSSGDTDQLFNNGNSSALDPAFTAVAAAFTGSNTVGSLSEPNGASALGFYIGPNFQFSIPEPSVSILLGISLAGVALSCVRRRVS